MDQISNHLHHLIHEYYNIAGEDCAFHCVKTKKRNEYFYLDNEMIIDRFFVKTDYNYTYLEIEVLRDYLTLALDTRKFTKLNYKSTRLWLDNISRSFIRIECKKNGMNTYIVL